MISQTCHTIWWAAFFLSPSGPFIKQGGELLALVVPPHEPSDKTRLWCWDEGRRREDRGRRWTAGVSGRRLLQEDRGRTDTMRPSAAWTLLLFLLVQGASRACTGTESGLTEPQNIFCFERNKFLHSHVQGLRYNNNKVFILDQLIWLIFRYIYC